MRTEIHAVGVADPVSTVRRLMVDHGIHHVPVLDGDQLVGMISFTDLLALGFGADIDDGSPTSKFIDQRHPLREIMEEGLVTIGSRRTLADAARMLTTGKFHSLPVVDEDGDLVGILTSTDLIEQLYELLTASEAPSGTG